MDWFNELFKSVKLLLISHFSFLYSQNKSKRSHLFIRIVNISILLIIFLSINELSAEGDKYQKGRSLKKSNGTPYKTHFNINNISTWIYNNGDADISPTGNSGFEYPKGSGKTAVFESGLLWGAKVQGEVRVGGSTYNQGLLPGRIDENGLREDTSLEHVRIYRVRPDWKFGDLSAEIIDEEGTEQEIRDQYEKDWNEWPAIYGAPFKDIDENGIYDPFVDVPGVNDADQTIWYVANDFDPATTRGLYGSDPMGIEMQVTIWGYNTNNSFRALDNTVFKKYKLINKSVNNFDSMYVAMWADPDLGGAGDDYVGCDPELSLMYCYNGDSDDSQYGSTIPAVGFDLVQGPIVIGNSDDDAIYNGKIKKGYKNLPMTSHYFTICGGLPYTCPILGDYEYGTLRMWKILRGLLPVTGEPFISPVTGQITKFTLDGDPVKRTGWLDGWLRPPGDRTQTMSSGPFTLATGDIQEVVFAEIIAGGVDNVDRLQAITMLKHYDREVQNFKSNLLTMPPAIKQPNVVVSSLDQEIILSWGLDDEERKTIEEYDNHGYKFQGYVVYQYHNLGSSVSNAIPIATYDLIDGTEKVIVSRFNVDEGIFTDQTKFSGLDSGIKRFLSISSDTIKASSLYNGSEYYFAVSSYAVSSNSLAIPKFIESPIQILKAIPQKPKPGVILPEETHSTGLEVTHSQGSANASVSAKVVDPNALTGDDYEVFFQEQHYYLDIDGKWKKTNYADSVGKALGKLGDVSPSTVTGISVTSPIAGTRDLKFIINVVSPDFNYAEGVKLTFPQGVQINSADTDYYYGFATMIDNNTNSVIFGKEVKDATDLTGAGIFAGGELITVNINATDLPLNVNYTIYDDGWATLYCADTANLVNCDAFGITDAIVINAEGVCSITKEAFVFRTAQEWNVKNVTKDVVVLEDQIVINEKNLFTRKNEGATAAPVVDGIQVSIDYGGYEPPVGILSYYKNGEGPYPFANGYYSIDMSDFGMHGWAASGRAIDAFGNGTTEIDFLQKDYELRFTGEYEPLGADNIYRVKDGTGSMATLYGARGYDIKDHPLNPNPGSSAPFLLRIPFEVWNVDDNQQVNLLVYHRIGSPADEPFYSFNPQGRMYCYVNNTPYESDIVNSGDSGNADTDNLTWNWIFWRADLTTGDVININYANSIQMGKDVFSFTAPSIVYDGIQAKKDVKKINVFPNPYYGTDLSEFGRSEHYVTFNHLPNKAIIRIYNLAGHRIRKISKDDESQFLKWNLMNENNFQIANGMYIVYIDLPDLGETKIIKLAVITEQLYQGGF